MENIRVLDLSPRDGVGRGNVQYAKQPLHSDCRSHSKRRLWLKLHLGSIPYKGQTEQHSVTDTGHHGGCEEKEVLEEHVLCSDRQVHLRKLIRLKLENEMFPDFRFSYHDKSRLSVAPPEVSLFSDLTPVDECDQPSFWRVSKRVSSGGNCLKDEFA